MIRKILFVTVTIIFVAVLAYAFLELKKGDIKKIDVIQAVPTDAMLIVHTGDLPGFIRDELSRNRIWEELTALPSVYRIHRRLSGLDSLFRQDDEVSELYKSLQVSLSLHHSGKDKFDFILYFPIKSTVNEKQIIRFIAENLPEGTQISNRKYNDVRIYDVIYPEERSRDQFSYAFSHGLFVLSPSSILLEEAIRQMDLTQNLSGDPGFREVRKTAGRNVQGNIYVNYNTFPDFAGHLFDPHYKERLSDLLRYADWSELDANLRYDAVLLNGYTYAESQSDAYLNVVLKHQPQKLDVENFVPSTVSAFLAMGLENFAAYKKDYLDHLEASGTGRAYLRDLQSFNEKYKIDVDQLILPVLERQAALVYTDIRNSGWEENTFVICHTRSRSLAEEKINSLLRTVAEKDGIDISSLILNRKVNDDVSFRFYRLPVPYLPMKLLGKAFEGANSKYCTFYDNYLVFGNSIPALSKYIHANQLGNNLGSDLDFSRFSEYLVSRSNLYFYLNIPASEKLQQRYLRPDLSDKIQKEKEHFSNFQALACQLTSENDLAYNNIVMKYTPELREEAQTLWESRLDHSLVIKPKLVVNHYTGEKEIFVQDGDKQIYLMNSSGRILWKQQIGGRILSDVYQIDYYQNGKLQMFFNTREEIHLLDRNGNYVERYPVRLRSPATNGMALFDYEKNMNYRICVAGEDRSIYMFNKEGNTVRGWEFGKTEGRVTKPVQHFRTGGRDYLVFSDPLTCYILNRRGQTRVRVQEHFPIAGNVNFQFESTTTGIKPRFALTDTTGRVNFIYLDGKVETVELGQYSADHYFEYTDLDGEGLREFIFVDGPDIKVFDADRSSVFSHTFRAPVSESPAIYQFSYGNRKIGLVSADLQEIYLLNNDGSMYSGFPLRGATAFSIGVFRNTESKFNLVVGSEDNFLYNYSVK